MGPRPKLRRAVTAVGIAASAFFTYLAVRDVDLDTFWAALQESEWWWLPPALIVLAAGVLLRAVRWRLLFSPETRPSLAATTRALLVGYLFNNILPARAGEAARIVMLHREAQTSRAEAVGTAVVERVYDLVTLLLLLFCCTLFVPEVGWIRHAAFFSLALAGVIVVATVMLVVYGKRPSRFVLRPLAQTPWIGVERLDAIAASTVRGLAALHRPRLAVPALLVTFVSWLVVAVSFWLVLAGFDLGLGLDAGLFVLVTANLAMVVPSLPAAVGVFEAAVIVSLRPYGVDESTALGVAVVLHAVNFFPFLIAGYWVLQSHALARRSLPAPARYPSPPES